MTRIKICGITTYEDAQMASQAGADMLGFNFYRRSPRYIEPKNAHPICDRLRKEMGAACPVLVGVFVNEVVGNVSAVMNQVGLNFAQLSGDESADMMRELRGLAFKAIQPLNTAMALDDVNYYRPVLPTSEEIPSLLLDAYHPNLRGGTGEQASTEIALAVKEQVPRLMLAGGLTPDNVAERVQAVQPWGVDVASGIEVPDQPGRKDTGKVKAFIEAARGAL